MKPRMGSGLMLDLQFQRNFIWMEIKESTKGILNFEHICVNVVTTDSILNALTSKGGTKTNQLNYTIICISRQREFLRVA